MMWEGDIDEYIELLRLADYIGADTENSGTIRPCELWSGEHYGTGFSTAIRLPDNSLQSYYFPFRHEEDNLDKSYLERLKPILETTELGFHNMVIDVATMETFGIFIVIPPRDTTILAHMVNEELPSKALNWLAKYVLGKEKKKDAVYKWAKIWGWDTVPVATMTPYACEDAELHYELMEIFWKDMEP